MGCRGHSILAPGTQTRKWVWLTWSMGKSQSSSHSSSQSPLCWDLFYFYWLLGYCWWPMVWSLTWRTADWLTKDTLPWGLPTAETDSWLLTAVWVFLWWSQLEESCCLGRHHPDCHPWGPAETSAPVRLLLPAKLSIFGLLYTLPYTCDPLYTPAVCLVLRLDW